MNSKKELRASLRARRLAVPPFERRRAARALLGQLRLQRILRAGFHTGIYLPRDGEIDTAPLIAHLWRIGARVYLPALGRGRERVMKFAPFRRDSRMRRNRYGIPEPVVPDDLLLPANRLDVLLLPLIGFDSAGNRLGTGGGFFDATLASQRWRGRTRVIGLAYDFQEVPAVQRVSWDIPLHAAATNRSFHVCGSR